MSQDFPPEWGDAPPEEPEDERPKNFPPGSFPQIHITRQAHHYVLLLIAASMKMEEANTPASIESAYHMLGRARAELTRYLGDLEDMATREMSFPLPPRDVHLRY